MHAAVVLDPRTDTDRGVIDALRSDGVTAVLDTLSAQRQGLTELVPPPAHDVLDEPTRWIHYPWRRTLVHVLGPKGFRMLRLDRNRNKITADEQDRMSQLAVGVVGLSVGHAVAHTLALEGLCGELRVADFDDLELSNLNRIPATVLDLGDSKTDIVARRIAELDPYLSVRVENRGITADTVDEFLDGLDVVVEECDSLDVKVLLREAARRRGIPVIMETSDRGLLDVERFDLDPDLPLFHGTVGTLSSGALAGLSTRDKVPHVMSILGASEVSTRFAASMVEVDRTISTWPQLGSDVALGGATVASAVRRIGLGRPLPSGRTRVDVDALLDAMTPPATQTTTPPVSVSVREDVSTVDVMDSIADAALRAPSGGNVQPWTISTTADRLTVTLDPDRTTGLDVSWRGSQVAVGAALFNARVAAAHAGLTGTTEIVAGADQSVTAHLTTGPGTDSTLATLYDAMMARSTNRHRGTPTALAGSVVNDLGAAAESEGSRVVIVTDRDAMSAVGSVLAESDRLRYLTESLHAEMMSELRWPGDDDPDTGIDVDTLALDATDLVKLDVARRPDVMRLLADWDTGTALGDDTRERMDATSAVAVVVAPGFGAAEHVRAGCAVERVWIEAERHGLAVHPVSPVFLYARDPEEFANLSPRYAHRLAALRRQFLGAVDIEENEPIALVLRLSHCTIAANRSRRRPR
ncbi:MAG: Rv1355c family protein [Rhodococcus sp. (in: high G+C Gram-positive bacteria)]